jgi:hypothetical protein
VTAVGELVERVKEVGAAERLGALLLAAASMD